MRGALRRRASSGSQVGAAVNDAEVAGSRSARLNQALCLLFVIVLVVLGRQAGAVEKQSTSSHITDHVEVDPYGVVPALRAPTWGTRGHDEADGIEAEAEAASRGKHVRGVRGLTCRAEKRQRVRCGKLTWTESGSGPGEGACCDVKHQR
jgi:hypothetical protein